MEVLAPITGTQLNCRSQRSTLASGLIVFPAAQQAGELSSGRRGG
jgi:hypothetical protein